MYQTIFSVNFGYSEKKMRKQASEGIGMGQTGQPAYHTAKGRSTRMVNYELLRIIAMLMVITLHYLNHTQSLLMPGDMAEGRKVAGTLTESFCIVAVNVYVLISGYFLVEAGFKVKRILILVCQILFYALLIPVILYGTGILSVPGGIYQLIQYVFPLQTEHYWFATSYVVLYLFTPLLNTAVKHMGQRQLQITLFGLLFWHMGVKSVMPIQLVTDRFGYDFGWFLCVYLVAAYIRLYGCRLINTAKRAWAVYIGSALLIFGISIGAYLVNARLGMLAYSVSVPYHYNFALCLLGAIGLFLAFGHVKMKKGRVSEWICRLSPFTFGVYLFHEHMDIRSEWAGWLEGLTGSWVSGGIAGFVIRLLLSVVSVYVAGTFVDMIRLTVFRFIGRYLVKTKLFQWIDGMDKEF